MEHPVRTAPSQHRCLRSVPRASPAQLCLPATVLPPTGAGAGAGAAAAAAAALVVGVVVPDRAEEQARALPIWLAVEGSGRGK